MKVSKPLLIGGGVAAAALLAWLVQGQAQPVLPPPPYPYPPPYPPQARPQAPPAYVDPDAQIDRNVLLEHYFGDILPFETIAIEDRIARKDFGFLDAGFAQAGQQTLSPLMVPLSVQKQQQAMQQGFKINRWGLTEIAWVKSWLGLLSRSGLFENPTFIAKMRGVNLDQGNLQFAMQAIGAGAGVGAKIGSVIPILGTAIGSVVGAVGGAIAGLINMLMQAQNEREINDLIMEIFGQAMIDIGAPPSRLGLICSLSRLTSPKKSPDPMIMFQSVMAWTTNELQKQGAFAWQQIPELPSYDTQGNTLTFRSLVDALFDPRERIFGTWPLLDAPVFEAWLDRQMFGCDRGSYYTSQEDAKHAVEISARFVETLKLDLGYLWPELLPFLSPNGLLLPGAVQTLGDVLTYNNMSFGGAYVTPNRTGGGAGSSDIFIEDAVQSRLTEAPCISAFRLEVAMLQKWGS